MNQELLAKIQSIINALQEIQSQVNVDSIIKTLQEIENVEQEFENLKTKLYSDAWPEAVNSVLICDPKSEDDKKERGIGIVEFLIEDVLTNEDSFLDFGCGEGHTTIAIHETFGCKTVGYDPKTFEWNAENVSFTSSYEEVKSLGPYKNILIFDVLDHLESETPQEILKKAVDVLAPNGKIYIRCHPWISRHGTHLYQELNKAFVHLVFTKEELIQMSINDDNNLNVTTPLNTYRKLFKDANLKIISERKTEENVEPFFKQPNISKRIIENTKHKNFPEFQMGLSFIDFVLSAK